MPENLCRFYLLEKKASGYVLVSVNNVEVQDSATASVKIIEDAARTAINQRFGLPSATDIKLDVYQPPEPFGDHGMKPFELRKTLQKIFNDDYRDTCSQLWPSDGLEGIEFKEHLLVVFVTPSTLEFEFFLFEYVTGLYFDSGKVTAAADQTVGVVKDAARKFILERTRSNLIVRITDVVETKDSLPEGWKQNPDRLEEYNMLIKISPGSANQHVTNTPLQKIRIKDGLIIHFGVQFLLVVLFEKAGSSYVCLGSHEPSILPGMDETIDTMIQQARMDLPRLSRHEFLGAYELLGEHKDLKGKTPKQIQAEIPLNDRYLHENTNYCTLRRSLQTLESGILIIIFGNLGDENHKRSLGSIERGPGIEGEKIAGATRKAYQ